MNKSALKILLFYFFSMIFFQIVSDTFFSHMTGEKVLVINLKYTIIVTISLLYILKKLKFSLEFLEVKILKKDYYTIGIFSLIIILLDTLLYNPVNGIEIKNLFSFLLVVILSPLVEEIIARKTIIDLLSSNRKNNAMISFFLFFILHAPESRAEFIYYGISSGLLCYIYYKNKNFYTVLSIHTINNLYVYTVLY